MRTARHAAWALAAGLLAVGAAPVSSHAGTDPANGLPAVGGPRSATVPRFEETDLRVDGVLDEPAWTQATVLDGFHQYQPVDSRPAEERTEVRVFYTPTAICFGIRAWDSQPATIHASVADRDALTSDDAVTIYLDTFNDRRRAFFFTVNPLGIQEDGVRTEAVVNAGGVIDDAVDRNPDFLFESRGQLTGDGYSVEVRIPFKSLRFPNDTASQAWGLNIERRVRRTGYVDTWTDVRRGHASFLTQSGILLGLRDLHPGRVVEFQPFVTAAIDGRRDLARRTFSRDALDPDSGLSLRLGLSPDVSLDATLNPDFSQVETDVGQVRINERFRLFFSEKRPFFLESIDLLSAPNRLIYTRQVVHPIFGAKLTLKRGRMSAAHLLALDEAPSPQGTTENAFVSATRLRGDVGRDSNVGLVATYRQQGDRRNTVLAADARWVFGKLYFTHFQMGGAWTDDGVRDGSTAAPLWMAEFDRTGRRWGFNYKVNAIGHDFQADTGFVPRSDVIEGTTSNRLSIYGERGGFVERINVYHALSGRWPYRGLELGEPLESGNLLLALANLRGGWVVWTQAAVQSQRFVPEDYAGFTAVTPRGHEPFLPPDRADGLWSFLARVELPSFRVADGHVQIHFGNVPIFQEASRGRETRWATEFNLRPTPSLRTNVRLILSQLVRERDGSQFARTLLPRVSLEYQPQPALFFRVIGEYRSERIAALLDPQTGEPLAVGGIAQPATYVKSLRVDALVSYEPRPGTVAFAGYGVSLNGNARLFGVPDLTRTSDGFFFKVAYRFRR